MDFSLSDEQVAIFDMAREFGREKIAPHAAEWERAGTIPKEIWPEVGELGLGGICVSEASGGSGLSRLESALVFEALSMSCPSVAAFLSIHNMCAWMIDSFGSDDLKAKYLAHILSMEMVFSYCLTEPGSGSDASALKTSAKRTNEGWVLNGTKSFISGGGYSDGYLVMCRTGGEGPPGISALIVEDDTPNLDFGALEDKMGWRAQPTRQVIFEDCPVPATNLLGVEGKGFNYAMSGLDSGRLNIAACSIGGARHALEKTVAYMSERRAFGRALNEFQALRFRLADMETELHAATAILQQAAWHFDAGSPDATKRCAMAKKFATDAGFKVANECLQLHGGYGYLADYGIEKIVRDLRVHQILEGTNEIMRLIIAREMLPPA
ncbi:MAG: acyl-CoA dehydrogenase family protein [Albidovulum sp.]|nr:acyl-CoA dehydrogenase family protein [Albidovulum sp.]MDE0532902.1 acyl-CoA dehydrogenase family protein [Albidovulum sp.]